MLSLTEEEESEICEDLMKKIHKVYPSSGNPFEAYLHCYGCYPLDWQDQVEKVAFSLRNDGYLTDACLLQLAEKVKHQEQPVIEDKDELDFSGCARLTDTGLYWLGQALKHNNNLEKILLDGCENITESGVIRLVNELPKNYNIQLSLQGSDVVYLPYDLLDLSLRKKWIFGPHASKYPLLSAKAIGESTEDYLTSSIVICPEPGLKVSLLEVLKDKNLKTLQPPAYVANWNGFNLIETSLGHPSFQVLVPPNVKQVLIPFDVKTDVATVKEHIEATVYHFVSQEMVTPRFRIPNPVYTGNASTVHIQHITAARLDEKQGLVVPDVPPADSGEEDLFHSEIKILEHFGLQHFLTFEMEAMNVSDAENGRIVVKLSPAGMKNSTSSTLVNVKGRGLVKVEAVRVQETEGVMSQTCYSVSNNSELLEEIRYPSWVHVGLSISTSENIEYVSKNLMLPPVWIEEQKLQQMCVEADFPISDEMDNLLVILDEYSGKVCACHGEEDNMSQELDFRQRSFSDANDTFNILLGRLDDVLGDNVVISLVYDGQRDARFSYNCATGRINVEGKEKVGPKNVKSGDGTKSVKSGDSIALMVQDVHVYGSVTKNVHLKCNGMVIYTGTITHLKMSLLLKLEVIGSTTCCIQNYCVPEWISREMEIHRDQYSDIYLSEAGFCSMIRNDDTLITFGHRDADISTDSHNVFCGKWSLTKEHPNFSIKVSKGYTTEGGEMDTEKELYLGVGVPWYYFRNVDTQHPRKLGSHPALTSFHLDMNALHKSTLDKPVNIESPEYQVGFLTDGVKFNEFGIPDPEQDIEVILSANGIEVEKKKIKYLGGGLNPYIFSDMAEDEGRAAQIILMSASSARVFSDEEVTDDHSGVNFIAVALQSDGVMALDESMLSLNQVGQASLSGLELAAAELKETVKSQGITTPINHRLYANVHKAIENIRLFQESISTRLKFIRIHLKSWDGYASLMKEVETNLKTGVKLCPHKYKFAKNLIQDGFNTILSENLRSQKVVTSAEVHEFCLHSPKNSIFLEQSSPIIVDHLLRLLHGKGALLYFHDLNPPVVILDVEWFVKVLLELQVEPKTTAEIDVKCLQRDTAVRKDRDLIKLAQETLPVKKLQLLLSILLEKYQLLRLPCIRRLPSDPKYYLVQSDHLKKELPVSLKEYWKPDTKEENMVIFQTMYKFPLGQPPELFCFILGEVTRFIQPLSLSCDSVIWHQGAAELIISREVSDSRKGDLLLHAKMFLPPVGEGTGLNRFADDYLWSIFYIYSDIIDCVLGKNGIVYTTTTTPQNGTANYSICDTHDWSDANSSSSGSHITVCTLCSGCAENGWSCDYFGIVGDQYRRCPCNPSKNCCRECGICQRCANKLWEIRSYLRPAGRTNVVFEPLPSDNQYSSLLRELRCTEPYLDCAISNEASFFMGNEQSTSICLLSSDYDLLLQVFPGIPSMGVRKASYLQQNRLDIQYLNDNPAMSFTCGDKVTLRMTDPGVLPASTAVVQNKSKNPQFGIQAYHMNKCKFWHCLGIFQYASYMGALHALGTDPEVGILKSQHSVSLDRNYYEIVIFSDGDETYQSHMHSQASHFLVGLVPKDPTFYRPEPGYSQNSIGWNVLTGKLYKSEAEVADLGSCTKGDAVGCGVKFSEDEVHVYFTKNGEKVGPSAAFEKEQFDKDMYAAVSLNTKNQAFRLLDSPLWQIKTEMENDPEKSTDPLTDDFFENDVIKIWPKQTLEFHGPEPVPIKIQSKAKYGIGYKVKVTALSRYRVRPSSGFVLPPEECVNIQVFMKSITDIDVVDNINGDKFLMQWIELDESEANDERITGGTTKDTKLLVELFKKRKPEAHKLVCSYAEPKKRDHDLSDDEPKLLPLVTDGPPVQPSYQLQVLKNGFVACEVWVPKAKYRLAVEYPKSQRASNLMDKARLPNYGFPQHWPGTFNSMDTSSAAVPDLFLSGLLLDLPKFPHHVPHHRLSSGMLVESPVQLSELKQLLETEDGISPNEPCKGFFRWVIEMEKEKRSVGHVGCQISACDSSGTMHLTIPQLQDIPNLDQILRSSQNGSDLKPFGHTPGQTGIASLLVPCISSTVLEYEYLYNMTFNKLSIVAPDYLYNKEAVAASKDSSKWLARLQHAYGCSGFAYQGYYTALEGRMTRFAAEAREWKTVDSQSEKILFLPKALDSRTLLYPSLSDLHRLDKLAVHRLCYPPGSHRAKENENVIVQPHLVNQSGSDPQRTLNFEDVYADSLSVLIYSAMASGKVRLPAYDELIHAESSMTNFQVEHEFQKLLQRYASTCGLVFSGRLYFLPYSRFEEGNLCPSNIDGCPAHLYLGLSQIQDKELDLECVKPYGEVIQEYRSGPLPSGTLPQEFPEVFCNLELLEVSSVKSLPCNMNSMNSLKCLLIKYSPHLVDLPSDIGDCPNLQTVVIETSGITSLPESFTRCLNLNSLQVIQSGLKSLPQGIVRLPHLTTLILSDCPLMSLPPGFGNIKTLKVLDLSGRHYMYQQEGTSQSITLSWYEKYLKEHPYFATGENERKEMMDLFHKCDADHNGALDEAELAEFNAHLFYMFPRFGHDFEEFDVNGGFPEEIFQLTNLETLKCANQAVRFIPAEIAELTKLREIKLNFCIGLESLPGTMGHLTSVESISLEGCPSLRTPPNEIVSRGTSSILAYLKRLDGGFTENWRTKLMLVGLGGAGKTSLLRALMSSTKRTAGTKASEVTDGIDIKTWTVKHHTGSQVTFSTWDFAGQSVYYNTHQFFLSHRAVYLLLWTTRLGYEHSGLDFWLSSIQCHAPKSPVFIVGTHADQVARSEIPQAELLKKFPQIRGFHFVSSITGKGIAELQQDMLEVTLQESYMGEKLPQVYLHLENKLIEARRDTSVLEWKKVKEFAMGVGIYDDTDVRRAIQFLSDLGTVQYFDNEFLRDNVVINPQWIVDVMACVVSIKDSPIKEGIFLHEDIKTVWAPYPENLHEWLLRLTEAFDLTFPLTDSPANVVPCLLPEEQPEYDWPSVDDKLGTKETLMRYRFTYMPAGLFNRTQARLFQLSDSKIIWKRGSLLKKNNHLALVQQVSDQEVQVKVIGPRPENVLYLVHEVIEGLIAEFYSGVTYDYLVPCPDCLSKSGMLEPMMFSASLIREACSWNAPFLQCTKFFHAVPMQVVKGLMPPDGGMDFDLHLESSVRALSDMRSHMTNDIFVTFAQADLTSKGDASVQTVHPNMVVEDLQKEGFSCWFKEDMDQQDIQDVMLALQDSKVILVFMSGAYEKDDHCRNLFLHAKDNLTKPYVIINLAANYREWQNTHLGYAIGAQEVFVNMSKISRYSSKLKELKEQLKQKMSMFGNKKEFSSVFISYCWSNSQKAVKQGTSKKEGSLGAGDPRDLKLELEKRGLSCWLDVEQAGKKGLFEDITQGIRHADVLVACVSKEYAESKNCMMELRFACVSMSKPVVFAVVGTGDDWKWTEIGLLRDRSRAPCVSFQRSAEDALLDELVNLVKDRIPKDDKKKNDLESTVDKPVESDMRNISYQEEYELAQRKLVHHIKMLAAQMNSIPFPRLVILDFVSDTVDKSLAAGESNRPKSGKKIGDKRTGRPQSGVRANTRPKSGVGASVSVRPNREDWTSEDFCIQVLCEHEKGWHCCAFSIPLDDLSVSDKQALVQSCAAYLGRIYALLKHSAIQLNCMHGEIGKKFQDHIAEVAIETNPDGHSRPRDLAAAYKEFRSLAIRKTGKDPLSGIKRCLLHTGKVAWLCNEHQQSLRVTVLSSDVAEQHSRQTLVTKAHTLLKECVDKYSHMRDPYRTQKGQKPPERKQSAVTTQGTEHQKESPGKAPPKEPVSHRLDSATRRKVAKKVKAAGDVAMAAGSWAGKGNTSKACQIL